MTHELSADYSTFSSRSDCCQARGPRIVAAGQQVGPGIPLPAPSWCDLCQEDKTENELSLKYGFRLLSSYQVTDTETLWIITEADRSVTTLLLPAEY